MSSNAYSENSTLTPDLESGAEHAVAWFALAVRAKHERSIARLLESKGYETFVPLYTKDTASKRKPTEIPLFPGVVFARFDMNRRLPVLVTPGVTNILGDDIPLSEIDSLRIATSHTYPVFPFPFLEAGHKVQITSGALSGVEGVVVEVHGSTRVILSVSHLKRSVLLELGMASLEVSEPSRAKGALQFS